jgi:hypothetical protein
MAHTSYVTRKYVSEDCSRNVHTRIHLVVFDSSLKNPGNPDRKKAKPSPSADELINFLSDRNPQVHKNPASAGLAVSPAAANSKHAYLAWLLLAAGAWCGRRHRAGVDGLGGQPASAHGAGGPRADPAAGLRERH